MFLKKFLGNLTLGIGGAALFAVFIALLFVAPVLVIWAINTLFGMSIEYSILNIVAGLVLIMVFRS